MGQQGFGNPRPRAVDPDLDRVLRRPVGIPAPAGTLARLDGHRLAPDRVARGVLQHALDRASQGVRIDLHRQQLRRDGKVPSHPRLAGHPSNRLPKQVGKMDRLPDRASAVGKAQQEMGQVARSQGGALGLLQQPRHVAGRLRRRASQREVSQDRHQQVVELVSETTRELAQRIQPARVAVLLGQRPRLGHVQMDPGRSKRSSVIISRDDAPAVQDPAPVAALRAHAVLDPKHLRAARLVVVAGPLNPCAIVGVQQLLPRLDVAFDLPRIESEHRGPACVPEDPVAAQVVIPHPQVGRVDRRPEQSHGSVPFFGRHRPGIHRRSPGPGGDGQYTRKPRGSDARCGRLLRPVRRREDRGGFLRTRTDRGEVSCPIRSCRSSRKSPKAPT